MAATSPKSRPTRLAFALLACLAFLALPAPASADTPDVIFCVTGNTNCASFCEGEDNLGVAVDGTCLVKVGHSPNSGEGVCTVADEADDCVELCQDGFAPSVQVGNLGCTEAFCDDPVTFQFQSCQGVEVCQDGVQVMDTCVHTCEGGVQVNEDACQTAPTLCNPGTPCFTIEATTFVQAVTYYSTSGGSVVARIGAVTVTFTTGQFATILTAYTGTSDLCTPFMGKPGIANCVDSALLPIQNLYQPDTVEQDVACLDNANVAIDVNGDGTPDYGSPAFTVRPGPC